MDVKYNMKNPGVKRLMREAMELANATEEYFARPLDDNLFEWHFTIQGPLATEFEGGYYHGRILLPSEYPMKPPHIILLTPNGRFETNKKICLSISGFHPENWQPSWSIRTALLALIAFMPSNSAGTIGSLEYSKDERKNLALKSVTWECKECGRVKDHLLKKTCESSASLLSDEEKLMIQDICFKPEDITKPTSDENVEELVEESVEDTNAVNLIAQRVNSQRNVNSYLITVLIAAISILIARRLFWMLN